MRDNELPVYVETTLALGVAILLQLAMQGVVYMLGGNLDFDAVNEGRTPDAVTLAWYKVGVILTQMVSFGLPAVVFARLTGQLRPALGLHPPRKAALLWLAPCIVIVALPAVQALMLDAESFRLPEWLGEQERALEAFEARYEKIIPVLTESQLPLNLVFIALTPAVCEELLFRGYVQHRLGSTLNPHVAIWVTGLLFSLMHFQAYGFGARWLLGVLFGYLTWWGGSLAPAMLGHFANNALSAVVVYAAANGYAPARVADAHLSVPTWLALGSGIATAGLLYGYQLLAQADEQ